MTQTILDVNDDNHRLLLAQWDAAGHAHIEEEQLERKTTLSSPNEAEGRIQLNRRFGAHILMLGRPQRDIHDTPILGDRVVQCPHCTTLFATFSQHDHHCTSACRDQAQAQRSEAKAKRRRDRQTKRSHALAHRSGVCLSCGNTFTLKRITAKTCSEKCRKRLQRKPALAEQYSQLPPVRTDLAELETAQAANGRAGWHNNRKEEKDLERLRILTHQTCCQHLHAIAEQAPALTSWLAHQSDATILAAFSPESRQQILGPDLWKRIEPETNETQA